jgi:chromosome segregation ATPase
MRITELNKELCGLQQTIHEKDNELSIRSDKLKEHVSYIEKLSLQVNEKNNEISLLRQQCIELNFEIRNTLKPELEAKKTVVLELGTDRNEKKARVSLLEQELDEKIRQVAELTSRVNQQEANLQGI